MAEREYFIDDRVEIPEEIMKMTKEERQAEIERLEAEAAAEKSGILAKKQEKIA
ncbi:MAG: hypothetical protein IJ055_08745 [Oscillospiraceae bacterium]|nr:hypothetical protein [Oscillospiraceae bacterium]